MTNLFREDNRIKNFIQNVEKQLYTEEDSLKIQEELYDHIECLVHDYLEMGKTLDEAISKALLQMGDPKEIGYSFTDYDGLKKRRRLMLTFKISGIAVLCLTIFSVLFFYSTWEYNQPSVSSVLPLLYNVLNLLMIFSCGSLFLGKSTKIFDFETTPQLIIWPTKTRFPWEYLILTVFFLPIVFLFFLLYFSDYGFTKQSLLNMWPILTIGYGLGAFFYSEKFRIPKYMVINEGIVIKGRFISWTAITKYTWQKDYLSKSKESYMLSLECFQRYNTTVSIKKSIRIHKRQKNQINQFLCERAQS